MMGIGSGTRRTSGRHTHLAWLALPCLLFVAAPSAEALNIEVNYEPGVPADAQTAFNSLVATYNSTFANTNTVSIDFQFAGSSVGNTSTLLDLISYKNWVKDMTATSGLFPGNNYLATAIGTLPGSDPIGAGSVYVRGGDIGAIGVTAGQIISTFNAQPGGYASTITFGTNNNFAYNGKPATNQADFLTYASHELNEALGIGSLLNGYANNNTNVTGANNYFEAEDFFRYGTNQDHLITTDPNAKVYFSYDGGKTLVDQFNEDNNAGGNLKLDRGDWIWGNTNAPTGSHIEVQNAVAYVGQAAPLLTANPTTSEFIVLSTLGYSVPEPSAITLAGLALAASTVLRRNWNRRA
jgi:hypothetical protein